MTNYIRPLKKVKKQILIRISFKSGEFTDEMGPRICHPWFLFSSSKEYDIIAASYQAIAKILLVFWRKDFALLCIAIRQYVAIHQVQCIDTAKHIVALYPKVDLIFTSFITILY